MHPLDQLLLLGMGVRRAARPILAILDCSLYGSVKEVLILEEVLLAHLQDITIDGDALQQPEVKIM